MKYGYDNPDDWDVYKYDHCAKVRYHAKRKKVSFNLTPDDFVYPDVCPILGIQITRKLKRENHPTMDRVNPLKGYVKGNTRMISQKANLMKQDNTIETLERLIQYIRGEI